MAANSSMNNNWLAFSLSPHSQQQNSVSHHFNSDDRISGTGVSAATADQCFDLSSHESQLPSLNLPPPFGFLEAFNSNTPQDWKSSSDMSMLMGSSCSGQNLENSDQVPKFENFLGVANAGGDCMYSSLHLPPAAVGGGRGGNDPINNDNNNNTIGLSMIKSWLRNNPTTTPPPSLSNNHNHDGGYGGGASGGDRVMGTTTTSSAQTLSLSMSTGSGGGGGGGGESCSSDNKRQMEVVSLDSQAAVADGVIEAVVPRKAIDTFGQRTSIYRGVTRHRWTGRYEAHLWDNSCRREGQTRKGRQVYLGGYDKEDKAARSYDLAALKYWGTTTTTNFPISNYEKEIEEMKHMTRQEYVASLRRKSSGFSRGASIYRGVTRHHQHGRWQARIGRVAGNKDLYLGTFSTQEEAAEAYDIAAIKFRGLNAVTNFEINRYDVKSILESSTLPIGGAAKRLKEAERVAAEIQTDHEANNLNSYTAHQNWPTIDYHQPQPFSMHYPYRTATANQLWCKQEVQDHHGFQDLHDQQQQLQLGNVVNTHNFFGSSVLHNLMNLDSSSMEHSSGSNSNSIVYGGGDGGAGVGNGVYQGGGGIGYNGGYVMPMCTMVGQDDNQSTQGGNGFGENEANPYGPSLLYYQPSSSIGSACNNWVPTAVPTTRATNMPTFTVWNDA